MLFTATRNVCVKANNPSPVLKVPEGRGGYNTGQYVQVCVSVCVCVCVCLWNSINTGHDHLRI
jgi:hypothetical protein